MQLINLILHLGVPLLAMAAALALALFTLLVRLTLSLIGGLEALFKALRARKVVDRTTAQNNSQFQSERPWW